MKKRLLASACLGLLLAVPTTSTTARAAESPSDSSVRAKESEVRQLKEELKAREAELEKLRHENEALRRERRRDRSTPSASTGPGTPAPATPPPQPSRPLPNVPAPGPDEAFDAADLVAWFSANPTEAAQKFVGREFVVRGIADRFAGVVLQRKFALELEPPGADRRIRAIIGMPAQWNSVFAARNEESLVLRGERGNRTLLKRGDLVTFRARCEGLKGDEIRFDRGELIQKH